MSQPRRQALVVHTFLVAEASATPDALRTLTDAADRLGIDQPVNVGRSGSILEVRRRPGTGGFHEIVTARVADVIVVSVLLAPNESRHDWRRLRKQWEDALCDVPAALGSTVIQLGLWPRRGLTRPQPAAPADSCRTGDLTLWELPDDDERRRRIVVMAPPAAERALDQWVWYGSDRAVPPLTRYFVHAAVLRNQSLLLAEALPRLRTARDRAAEQCAKLARLVRSEQPSIADLSEAGRALSLVRTEQGGLITAEATADDMAQTVRAAARNMSAALGSPLPPDQEIAGWLSDQLDTELTYLRSARRQADELARLGSAVIDQRQRKRQQVLALLQASILGSLLMALAAIQSLEYRVPLPGSLKAPLIVLLAAIALLLPPALLNWPDRTSAERPVRRWYIAGSALLGAAAGWLASDLGWLTALQRAAPPLWSALVAVLLAGLAAVVGWVWVRRWEKIR
jgi:hypothetical protein